MKFVCLGYLDESEWKTLSNERQQAMMEECLEYDDELRRGGHFLGGEALDSARRAVTLRVKNERVDVTDGPFAETKEVLGGILLLEARDLNHAIALMSKHPGVRVGPFEIRPSAEEINRLVEERGAAVEQETGRAAALPESERIAITRIVDAPPHSVFQAWLEPEQLSRWWGPRSGRADWTTPHAEIDPRPRGEFRTCVRSPDGEDHWARGEYVAIDEPNRLEFTHGWGNDAGAVSEARRVMVRFDLAGERTLLTFQIDGYRDVESRNREIEGWSECLDRLVQYFAPQPELAAARESAR